MLALSVSDKRSPLYEDVPEVLSLPPPPDEGGAESDLEDNILMEFREIDSSYQSPQAFTLCSAAFCLSHFSPASATTAGDWMFLYRPQGTWSWCL